MVQDTKKAETSVSAFEVGATGFEPVTLCL